MQFTYDAYRELLAILQQHGYAVADYHNWQDMSRCVILRHDIDNSIKAALKLARLEWECGVTSTWFVLVNTDLYNVFSRESRNMIKCIQALGHRIGLHFDETAYPECTGNSDLIREKIHEEAGLLQNVTGTPITTVSMHRPSKAILDADLQISGIINSYSKLFFKKFKYMSDSRRHWTEPVCEVIEKEKHSRIHLLTHAFWYHKSNIGLRDSLVHYIDNGRQLRYIALRKNITKLDAILYDADNDDSNQKLFSISEVLNNGLFTQRLYMRKLEASDADAVYDYSCSAESLQFLSWGPYKNCQDAVHFIENSNLKYEFPTDIQWGIEIKENHKLIGALRIYNIDFESSEADVSYILNEKYIKKGYMTEAVKAVIDMCHEKLGIQSVYCDCAEENTASFRLIQRCGMKQTERPTQEIEVKSRKIHMKRYVHQEGVI